MRSNMVRVNTEAILSTIMESGMSKRRAAEYLGHSASYINTICKTEHMARGDLILFCMTFGADEDSITYHEPEPSAIEPNSTGWRVDIDVMGDKVAASIIFNGVCQAYGQAAILNDGIVQAISYATFRAWRNASAERE